MNFYTGVGSRETPANILQAMTWLAGKMEQLGFILRSGRARGADLAFENGIENPHDKRIYLPGDGKNENPVLWKKAVIIALRNHPSPRNAMKYIDYLARNAFQVLGDDLDDPSKFLVCWTKGGKDVGGTGTTIRIAREFNVPIYNLHSVDANNILKLHGPL